MSLRDALVLIAVAGAAIAALAFGRFLAWLSQQETIGCDE